MSYKIKNTNTAYLLLLLFLLRSEPNYVAAFQLKQLLYPNRNNKNNFNAQDNNKCFQNNRYILHRYESLKICLQDDNALDIMNNTMMQPSLQNRKSIDTVIPTKVPSSDRRNYLQQLSQASILTALTSTVVSSPLWTYPMSANAAATVTTSKTTANMNYISADAAKITHKVFFNVRISRSDGTFYIRDEDETNVNIEPENRVYYGQLIFGLFGNNAPKHVQRFLEYIVDPTTTTATATPLSTSSSTMTTNDETSYPSYSRSSFTQYDDATGILYGGTIPSLEIVEIQQSVALRYGNRLMPAKLWIEDATATSVSNKISHDRMGLLTHAQLDATPVFGITTRNDATILNPTHTVFGTFIMNSDAKEFLHRISTIPTYSIDRPIAPPQSSSFISTPSQFIIDDNNTRSATTLPSYMIQQKPDTMMTTMKPATDAIYNLQREFFRNTAKTLGDTRINKLYNGKLLRRVEVTQVGLL